MKIYKAIYERDPSGVWTVELANVEGVHSWGRTIEQARDHLHDALALWLDDPRAARTAQIEEEIRVPPPARKVVKTARELRAAADELVARSQSALREAVQALVAEQHFTIRDAAAMLGISFQWVHQIASGEPVVAERPARYSMRRRKRAG